MPRKPTGGKPGRPRKVLRADGSVNPCANELSAIAKRVLAKDFELWKKRGAKWKVVGGKKQRKMFDLASAKQVAAEAGTVPRTVQRLRNESAVYENQFVARAVDEQTDLKYDEGLTLTDRAKISAAQSALITARESDSIDRWVRQEWKKNPGYSREGVQGFDNKFYYTPYDYAEHLKREAASSGTRLIPYTERVHPRSFNKVKAK